MNEYTRNRNLIIGKIDILKNFSFFEVENSAEKDILKGFKDSQWNGYKLTVEISKPKNHKENKKRKGLKRNKRVEKRRNINYPKGSSFKSRFKLSKSKRKKYR